ncbi:MAG: RNA recognition motif domain-containing protein [bacterium]
MKIFVGNLSRRVTQDTLQELFETFGQVASAEIIRDKFSGESKGFAFVEMPSKSEAEAAMTGLNGREVDGKSLTVNEARPRENDRRGGSGGGGGFNRRGGSGGSGGGFSNRRSGGGGGGGRRSW